MRCFDTESVRSVYAKCFPWILQAFLVLCVFVGDCSGEVESVAIRVPNAKAWTGQRVPFFVELRANGSFVGTARFDLEQVPGCIIIKIGNPVISSKEMDGESWFIQSHEFALFSQKKGRIKVPEFPVRFSSRKGFVGDASEKIGKVPAWEVEIERPPNSSQIGFLITSEEFDVNESWDHPPGPSRVGEAYKRTISQTATDLSGMALAPASKNAPAGIKIYPGKAETKDELERGAFKGHRTEIVTYLLTEPGLKELPAVTYVWWNPKTEQLLSKTLPAVQFDVAALPEKASEAIIETQDSSWLWPSLFIGAVAFLGLFVWLKWQLLNKAGMQLMRWLNPPHRVHAKELIRACRDNNLDAAETAWFAWQSVRSDQCNIDGELRRALDDMHRCRYGAQPSEGWRGENLRIAFQQHLSKKISSAANRQSEILPKLNP